MADGERSSALHDEHPDGHARRGSSPSATHLIPDLHHFRGSFGGKDVIPLWRDAECTQANVTAGLLDELVRRLGAPVEPIDLFAYCYALLSAPSYASRFSEELAIPGPRIPLTSEARLFREAVELGERLVWLHTFSERLVPGDEDAGVVPRGAARCTHPIGVTQEAYPTAYEYDEGALELRVGDGIFKPVSRAVWEYSVSGLHVLGSWLDYRLRDGAGRQSSNLDAIRPRVWPAAFTEELLGVVWVLEHTVALQPELDALLERIAVAETIASGELPVPTDTERKPPDE